MGGIAANANWVPPETMAQRLREAGVLEGRGFSTNASNFSPTADEQQYAEHLRALLAAPRRERRNLQRRARGGQLA